MQSPRQRLSTNWNDYFLAPIRVDWRREMVDEFVAAANSGAVAIPRPAWFSQQDGAELTTDQFVEDAMMHLAEIADERRGDLLQCTSADQSNNVFRRLGHVEMNPFVQACMQALPDGKGSLAVIVRVLGGSQRSRTRTRVVGIPPLAPGARRVFF